MIDSEGIGALDEDKNHDTRIFLLALLLSSYFIYNSMGTIDENALQTISLIVNLSNQIRIKEKEKSVDVDKIPDYFPSFLWVVRDFSLRLADDNGNEITSSEYLENALSLSKGTSDVIERKNKVRRMIKHFFKERDWVTVVRPVEDEKQLQNLAKLQEIQLRDKFVEQIKAVKTRILKKVNPKKLNGKILNGPMLLELLKSYVDAINDGKVPCIENAWSYVLKHEWEQNMRKLILEYKCTMNNILPIKSTNYPAEILRCLHNHIIADLMKRFSTESYLDYNKEYKAKTLKTLDHVFDSVLNNLGAKMQGSNEKYI